MSVGPKSCIFLHEGRTGVSEPSWLLCPVDSCPPTQSINSARAPLWTKQAHLQTQKLTKTKSLPRPHLGACAYSVQYSGQHALDHFLIVIMFFN